MCIIDKLAFGIYGIIFIIVCQYVKIIDAHYVTGLEEV